VGAKITPSSNCVCRSAPRFLSRRFRCDFCDPSLTPVGGDIPADKTGLFVGNRPKVLNFPGTRMFPRCYEEIQPTTKGGLTPTSLIPVNSPGYPEPPKGLFPQFQTGLRTPRIKASPRTNNAWLTIPVPFVWTTGTPGFPGSKSPVSTLGFSCVPLWEGPLKPISRAQGKPPGALTPSSGIFGRLLLFQAPIGNLEFDLNCPPFLGSSPVFPGLNR